MIKGEYCRSSVFAAMALEKKVILNFSFFFCADEDEVYCVIKRGEYLGSEKVVHVPGIPVGSTALTKLDEEKIRTGIQLKVDVILVPGVRNSVFFDNVRKFVGKSSIKSLRPAHGFCSSISSRQCLSLEITIVSIQIFHRFYLNLLKFLQSCSETIFPL